MKLRIVLDTAVLVAGLRSRNGPNKVALGNFEVVCTPALFLEYEDVLKRQDHRAVHGLRVEQVDDFLNELATLIVPVDIHFHWRPQLSDPDDEMVLEAAVNGRADAIVTNNIKDFAGVARKFNTTVLSPIEMLRKVRK